MVIRISTGGRRSPFPSPQSSSKSCPPFLVYFRTCTKGDKCVRDTMGQDMHVQETTKAGVSRAATLTYVLFESPSVELQADQSGRVKTSRLSKNPASYLITWSQLLEGFGFEGPLTQYSGNPSRASGTRSVRQILKNRPFHPENELWKGVKRTLPGTLLRVTQRLCLCLFTSKK